MVWFWNRTPQADRVARAVLKRLSRQLAKEYERQRSALRWFAFDPERLQTAFAPLRFTADAQKAIKLVLQARGDGQAAQTASLLCDLGKAVVERLRAEPWEHLHAWRALSRTLDHVLAAQKAMLAAADPIPARPALGKKRRVVVTEELLQECYQSLFPAERMLVIAGRRIGDTTRLDGIFDVTGDQNWVHVRADRDLLGRALIKMHQSDAFLAAWVHSHPGLGPAATRPSQIDIQQDQDWLRDYPNLLNMILVEDGWLQLWGSGLESGQIEVELLGRGLLEENEHGYIYRVEQPRRLPVEPAEAAEHHRDGDRAAAAPEA
jgi:hypothetical protein